MARKYTVNAASHRWPVQFFFTTLDLTAINAHIIYTVVTGSKISRQRYLLQLSKELRSRFVEERKANSHQSSHTNSSMQKKHKQKHCQSKSCTNKTRETCSSCSKLAWVNALESRRNSFIVRFTAIKHCSCCILSYFFIAMHAVHL